MTQRIAEIHGLLECQVVVADQSAIIRKGIQAILENFLDFKVVEEALDGRSALQAVESRKPHVVIIDVSLPRLEGISTTRFIKEKFPDVKVLAISYIEDKNNLQQVLEAGASGFILKSANEKELIKAVRTVAEGGVYLDPKMASKIVSSLVGGGEITAKYAEIKLTPRETEVLKAIAFGFSNKEISEKLKISVKTVETHRARSMEKLGFKSRSDIVRYAYHHGWFNEL